MANGKTRFETVEIDGQTYTREIQPESEVERYIESDKAMRRIGIRLDSYSARVEQGRKSVMAAAKDSQNHKGLCSRKAARARHARAEQRKLSREAKAENFS